MSAALRPMTLEQFLAWERGQELRHEFDGIGPVAMNGGSIAHSAVASNLVRALEDALEGGPCRAFRGNVKIQVAGRIRYPDAVVTCAPVSQTADIVPNPVVVFEVLSPSTARTDRVTKFAEYQATASIQIYAMLEQDEVATILMSRQGELWAAELLRGEAVMRLPPLGVSLSLPALYRGIDMAPAES